ncbi:hypothetical protein HAZT_HAZT004961 [Hyalella azteca]|uniref:Reverse transcriptase/retrotransposon-derived protein RNase H-like domain-containing protein n=1 Tax=Hyalella azteca TaxID=294128 RepID=A0A6A0H9E4_HYAAZ|nr:hypothetical protein HAZT_HAZT004961 [Hyalella azteca]
MYDPLGIKSPVTPAGKLLQRAVIPPKASSTKELVAFDWDDPLPDKDKPSWKAWKSSLSSASAVSVPRSYTPAGFHSTDRQLHVFCDASEEAIGYAIYLRSQSSLGEICVSLVMSNSKVAPRGATSIPRLELCAAVEAAEETVLDGWTRQEIVSAFKVLPRNATNGRFSEYLLILSAQKSAFPEVFLRKARELPENHVLSSLSPFIDANG